MIEIKPQISESVENIDSTEPLGQDVMMSMEFGLEFTQYMGYDSLETIPFNDKKKMEYVYRNAIESSQARNFPELVRYLYFIETTQPRTNAFSSRLDNLYHMIKLKKYVQ